MERREPDDTTKPDAPPTREHTPGGYYYDDATGYEIYSPAEDEEGKGGDGDQTPGSAGILPASGADRREDNEARSFSVE